MHNRTDMNEQKTKQQIKKKSKEMDVENEN